MLKKFNNKQFKEHFNHIEPFTYYSNFTETFNHSEPPTYVLDFTEGFDS